MKFNLYFFRKYSEIHFLSAKNMIKYLSGTFSTDLIKSTKEGGEHETYSQRMNNISFPFNVSLHTIIDD